MAFKAIQITLVEATPTPLLVRGNGDGQLKNITGNIQDKLPLIIQNLDDTDVLFIGGPDVSDTLGVSIATGESLRLDLYGEGEIPYAYSAGAIIVGILAGRQ